MASNDTGSMTGLSAGEARDFHRIFVKSTIAFTGWAFAAHVLVHFWRPWLYNQGTETSSLMDGLNTVATVITATV